MKNRSRIDIISQILEAAAAAAKNDEGITRTRIIYRAFLNNSQSNKYLSIIVKSGLLNYDKKKAEYAITEKGKRLLKTYGQMGQVIKIEN